MAAAQRGGEESGPCRQTAERPWEILESAGTEKATNHIVIDTTAGACSHPTWPHSCTRASQLMVQ